MNNGSVGTSIPTTCGRPRAPGRGAVRGELLHAKLRGVQDKPRRRSLDLPPLRALQWPSRGRKCTVSKTRGCTRKMQTKGSEPRNQVPAHEMQERRRSPEESMKTDTEGAAVPCCSVLKRRYRTSWPPGKRWQKKVWLSRCMTSKTSSAGSSMPQRCFETSFSSHWKPSPEVRDG